jgi:hypothetical protein
MRGSEVRRLAAFDFGRDGGIAANAFEPRKVEFGESVITIRRVEWVWQLESNEWPTGRSIAPCELNLKAG